MKIRYTGETSIVLNHEGTSIDLVKDAEFDADTLPDLPYFEKVTVKPSKPPNQVEHKTEGADA